jgi:hypothetical protein
VNCYEAVTITRGLSSRQRALYQSTLIRKANSTCCSGMRLSSLLVTVATCTCPLISGFYVWPARVTVSRSRIFEPKMALDDFFMARLDSIKRTFEALTERLADPDVANDRKQMLVLSRERAAVEKTVDAYDEWKVNLV